MGTSFWNDFDLKPPPTFTSKLPSSDVSHSSLRKLSDVFWDALTLLQNQQALSTEAATLSRLIYRMKNLFHGDKGFKTIEKINHCLRHYLSLNLVPMYDNIFRTIPWDCSEKEIYCPTRQMLEYVLLRTQGLAALLCRIVHTCLEGAFLFKSRMSSGHHWHVSLLCLGVISRIWALAKHIFEACVKWYNVMLPFLKIFQPNGPTWLSEGYIFPPDLTKWLDVSWMEAPIPSNEKIMNFHGGNNNTSFEDNDEVTSLSNHITPKIQSISDDVGVSISRSSLSTISRSKADVKLSDTNTEESRSLANAEENFHGSANVSFQEDKSAKAKLKPKKRKLGQSTSKNEQECKIPILDNGDHETEINSRVSIGDQKNSTAVKSKKVSKREFPLIISQSDVQNILNSETKRRSLTSSLDDQQWALLRNLVSKLNFKLKKTQEEKKKHQILEQIRKAFKIALS